MAAELAVNFLPGYPCFVDEPSSHWVRLNFTFPAPQEIEEGVSRFLRAVQGAIAPRQQEWDRRQAGTRPIV
jgi:DNA-binding transcriptional MocR family regulator